MKRRIKVEKPYFKGFFVEREKDSSVISAPKELKIAIKQGKDFVKHNPEEMVLITKIIRVIQIPVREKLRKVM